MELKLVFRPVAQRELDDLYDWIAERAGTERALAYIAGVRQRIERVRLRPGIGAPKDELGEGVRSVSYRRRTVVLYRSDSEVLTIIRVLHGGRDPRRAMQAAD